MTSSHPQRPASYPRMARSRSSVAVRVAVSVLGAAALAPAAAFALFVAAVEWTGCFIECGEPDPAAGFAVTLLAAALVAAAPLLVAVLFASRRWAVVSAGTFVAVPVIVTVLATAG